MPTEESLVRARSLAEESENAQERNRIWWESMPMTYADWDKKERIPQTKEDFLNIERLFIEGNPWLRDHFDFRALKGKKVLEIGFGSGCASCLFAKGGADVTAIDITAQASEIANRNAAAQGLAGIKFMQMDAEKMTFPDSSFDYVFTWGVLHHSSRTEDAIRHVARVLKPGGSGLIMVYNKGSLRYWLKGLYLLFAKGKIFKGYTMQSVQGFATDGYYQRHFSSAELSRVLADVGLATTETAVSHIQKDKYIPGTPRFMDPWLKRNWGWLLTKRFTKSVS